MSADAGLVAGGQVDPRTGIALRHRHGVLLDHGDLGTALGGREGRRNTRCTRADHDDVEAQRFLDIRVGNRPGLGQKGQCRAAIGTAGEIAAAVHRRASSFGGQAGQPERTDARGTGMRRCGPNASNTITCPG